jgi:hypothetical protein
MRTVYYQEPNGDYLVAYYGATGTREPVVRASAITGMPSSVCTCEASRDYIKSCNVIRKADVPQAWKRWF